MATFLAYHKGWEGRTFLILTYYLGTIILFMGVTYFYSCFRSLGGRVEGSSPVTPLRSAVLCLVIRKTVTHKVLVVVRTPSPIDWYFYPTYNPVGNSPSLSEKVYRNRLSQSSPAAWTHESLCHQYSIRSRLVKRITPNESDFCW
jgi:hypothetical protein